MLCESVVSVASNLVKKTWEVINLGQKNMTVIENLMIYTEEVGKFNKTLK